MSIFSYNGGGVVAMTGDKCVAVATDLRFGQELKTVTTNFPKVFQMAPNIWLGLTGLATDIQTVHHIMEFRKNMFELRENRKMKPRTFANVLSNILYERRFAQFFVSPVVAGLDAITSEPFICAMDSIGCITNPADFVVGGTCEDQLYGMCETLWRPDMNPDQLFECISQALVNAFDRDAASGWGALVHVIEQDKITTRRLKTRMD